MDDRYEKNNLQLGMAHGVVVMPLLIFLLALLVYERDSFWASSRATPQGSVMPRSSITMTIGFQAPRLSGILVEKSIADLDVFVREYKARPYKNVRVTGWMLVQDTRERLFSVEEVKKGMEEVRGRLIALGIPSTRIFFEDIVLLAVNLEVTVETFQ